MGDLNLKPLPKKFDNRDALIDFVKDISLIDATDTRSSPLFKGGDEGAKARLEALKPKRYGKTRNHIDGDVSYLSPYIRHGLLSIAEVRDYALKKADGEAKAIHKFIQELGWRDYWQRLYYKHPDKLWADIEPYKTGFEPSDYADELPDDIATGKTGLGAIDGFIKDLIETGYVHNHARMYLASYVVHFRRIKWQAGAAWFLHHLIDGDPASNNFSWQWIASTFSHRPYIFNLDNIQKFTPGDRHYDLRAEVNKLYDDSYEALNKRLFPNLDQEAE